MITLNKVFGILVIALLLAATAPVEAKHASMRAYANYSTESQIEQMRLISDVVGLVADHVTHGGYTGGAGQVCHLNAGASDCVNDSNRLWNIMWNNSRVAQYGAAKNAQMFTELRNLTAAVPGLPNSRSPEQQFDFTFGAFANRSGDITAGQALVTDNVTLYSLPNTHNNTARYTTGQTRGGLLSGYMLRIAEQAIHVAGNLYKDTGTFFSQ